MDLKPLGTSVAQIPAIGMGTWRYHAGPETLRSGIDAGMLFIDTAESYGTENTVGEAIRDCRDRVFVATKVSPAHFRHADVLQAAENSLRRLRTSHIDLYQLHEPSRSIPIEETLSAMEDLVDSGKIRFIGVSNFSRTQLERAQKAMRRHPIVSNQVRFNLIDRTIQDELLPYCQAHRITVIAYSPLARGLSHILDCDDRSVVTSIAREADRTPVQVALNWCLCHENVVAIPKGNSAAHLRENSGAAGWRLNAGQLETLTAGVRFRRRRSLEVFLRRHLPPSVKTAARKLLLQTPRSLRSRIP